MRRIVFAHVARTAFLLAGCALMNVASGADAPKKQVTFQRDVLPILAKHCQSCHSPGKSAPISFLTYKTTRPWARQIKALVGKTMPPVVGTAHYTVLTQGEGPSKAEISTLVSWVDEGARK
jgi:hypothetical protein